MTDRELLEVAARAAGIVVEWDGSTQQTVMLNEEGLRCGWWNPLMSDGTALRLAVKLRIDIAQFPSGVRADAQGTDDYYVPHDEDPCAATRRAIVRAAAAMAG